MRRFIDLAKFLDLLENRQLYFCRADLLEDSREGRLTDFERTQIRGAHPDPGRVIRGWEGWREESYLNCWYAGEDESMAMWKLFGDSSCSLAIGSTVGAIKKTLAQVKGPVYVGKVEYLDWTKPSPQTNNVIGMMVRKSRGYLHEKEVRLIIFPPPWQLASEDTEGELQSNAAPPRPTINVERVANQMADALRAVSPTLEVPPDQLRWICIDAILKSAHHENLEQKRPGVTVPVDPNELVTELIVGPDVPDWVYKLLFSVSLRYGLSARIRWSDLKSGEQLS